MDEISDDAESIANTLTDSLNFVNRADFDQKNLDMRESLQSLNIDDQPTFQKQTSVFKDKPNIITKEHT